MNIRKKSRPRADNLAKELASAIDTSHKVTSWVADEKGYFTIKPFFEEGKVFVRFYDRGHRLRFTFAGTTTQQLVHEIIERGLVSRLDHAAYLGKEIEKAVLALRFGLLYVQDEELDLGKHV